MSELESTHKSGEQKQVGGEEGEGEADSTLSMKPNAGLNPWTLGSRPEPKADA